MPVVGLLVTDDLSRPTSSTVFTDLKDPPRFSQLIESAKNSLLAELRDFFDQARKSGRLAEFPTIEKYAFPRNLDDHHDPYESAVTLIKAIPDINQNLPLIAVSSTSGSEKKMGISGAFVGSVQQPCRLRSTKSEPFTGLFSGGQKETLQIQTEDSSGGVIVSTLTFFPWMAVNSAQVSVAEVVEAINPQALYFQALPVKGKLQGVTEENLVQIEVGGPFGRVRPNSIKIVGGSAALLTALGFSIGDKDTSDNPERPPANRYVSAADFNVSLDIVAEDDNTRTELSDLIWSFLTYYLDDKRYSLYGRGVTDERFPLENTQIVVRGQASSSGESDVSKPQGDEDDRFYVNRFVVPLTVLTYIDRHITLGNVTYTEDTELPMPG